MASVPRPLPPLPPVEELGDGEESADAVRSAKFLIPGSAWTPASAKDTAKKLQMCFTMGYDSGSKLRDMVARWGMEWGEIDMGTGACAGWNLRDMWVLAYLDGLPALSDLPLAPPPTVCLFDSDTTVTAGDVVQMVMHMAFRWREVGLDEAMVTYVRRLESRVCEILGCWEDPIADTSILQRLCSVFASVWLAEELLDIIPSRKVQCPELGANVSQALTDWVNINAKRAHDVNMEMGKPYIDTVIRPGEREAYARSRGGVFASTPQDVTDQERSHVSSMSLLSKAREVDTRGANGILVFHMVNRVTESALRLNWIRHTLFTDSGVGSNLELRHLTHRRQPFILLVGAVYYIVDRASAVTWMTRSAIDAIFRWFTVFSESSDEDGFFDGEDFYDLDSVTLPEDFVFIALQKA